MNLAQAWYSHENQTFCWSKTKLVVWSFITLLELWHELFEEKFIYSEKFLSLKWYMMVACSHKNTFVIQNFSFPVVRILIWFVPVFPRKQYQNVMFIQHYKSGLTHSMLSFLRWYCVLRKLFSFYSKSDGIFLPTDASWITEIPFFHKEQIHPLSKPYTGSKFIIKFCFCWKNFYTNRQTWHVTAALWNDLGLQFSNFWYL